MKKTEKCIYLIIILILVVVIACSITYAITISNNNNEMNNNNENNEQENGEEPVLEDGITLKDTDKEGESIIQEYEVVLNGIKNNFNINYTYESCYDTNYCISGKYNNYNFYYGEFYNISLNNLFTIEAINQKFNENNFSIIKGTDNKNYLLVYAMDHLYIFDENLEIVNDGINSNWYEGDNESAFVIASITNVPMLNNYYDDSLNVCDNWDLDICGVYVKVENDKIYYLTPKISSYDYEIGTPLEVEERVYTINNSKVTYEVINTYETTEVFNMV